MRSRNKSDSDLIYLTQVVEEEAENSNEDGISISTLTDPSPRLRKVSTSLKEMANPAIKVLKRQLTVSLEGVTSAIIKRVGFL